MTVAPALVRLPYEEEDPKDLWKQCKDFQKRWNDESKSPSSERMRKSMAEFRRQRALSLVWVGDKLRTMPKGVSEFETYKSLTSLLDRSTETSDLSSGRDSHESLSDGCDAEDRTSKRQLFQHMKAYQQLETAATSKEELSERLIRMIHGILMKDLLNQYGQPVIAGAYRKDAACADDLGGSSHQFPDYQCIPEVMPSIVCEYNSKFSDPGHDPYQLASWLLYEVISLHPFEDGNGRLCRLLWCYSLMRDGLPFPTILTSGHTKSYKHYVEALIKSRRSYRNGKHPHLTSLTVVSVYNAWNNFYLNWDKYEKQ